MEDNDLRKPSFQKIHVGTADFQLKVALGIIVSVRGIIMAGSVMVSDVA